METRISKLKEMFTPQIKMWYKVEFYGKETIIHKPAFIRIKYKDILFFGKGRTYLKINVANKFVVILFVHRLRMMIFYNMKAGCYDITADCWDVNQKKYKNHENKKE